jgi:L,D-transpeptidase YcbB
MMWKGIRQLGDVAPRLLVSFLLLIPAGQLVAGQQDFLVPLESSPSQRFDVDWPEIARLNERLDWDFIWHRDGTITAQAAELYAWLSAADQEGLSVSDYHVPELRLLMDAGADKLLQRELLLTDGYLRLARDLRNGRYDPKQVDPLWQLPSDSFDPVTALASALEEGDLSHLLASLRPQSNAYLRLRQALARYRGLQSSGGWPLLMIDESLRPGSRHPAVIALRERLAAEGIRIAWPPADAAFFDPSLTSAVKAFQHRLGLAEDGVIGRQTLQTLNVPVETRIEQIRASMERWRWLPHDMEPQYLLINSAAFEIDLMEQNQTRFHKRTVNGREERQTPSFRSRVTHLVANPQWTVPRSIAVRDLLPKQQADAGFLQRRQIHVYRHNAAGWFEIDPASLDWSLYHVDNFPFVLKQDAGRENSLGRIKFHMPNPYDIYLHDTPALGLFERPNRAFSSGCVRVEAAGQLAELLLLRADSGEEDRFHRAMQTGETKTVSLAQPMPVYLTYFTSWVDEANEVHFRPDIYQRDTYLLLALTSESPHLAAQQASDTATPSL